MGSVLRGEVEAAPEMTMSWRPWGQGEGEHRLATLGCDAGEDAAAEEVGKQDDEVGHEGVATVAVRQPSSERFFQAATAVNKHRNASSRPSESGPPHNRTPEPWSEV